MASEESQWTVITYIAAHNNLESFGERSLEQILGVGSSVNLKLVVLLDRREGATRYVVGEPGRPAVEEHLNDFDSGDPDKLLETIRWAIAECPARRYALVLWSHGTGWQPGEISAVARQARDDENVSEAEASQRAARPGSMTLFRTTLAQILRQDDPGERAVSFDDGSGHSLDTLELGRVAGEIRKLTGRRLDLLGMDACLMASIEVAYQVSPHVSYLVASEEMVPTTSWPYDTILAALRDSPEMSARDLAALVVQHYLDYYTAHPPKLNGGDVTKVALDLFRVEEVSGAAGRLAGVLLQDMSEYAAALWRAQRLARKKETYSEARRISKFNLHLWDLRTLAGNLASQSSAPEVQRAALDVQAALRPGGVVIAEGHRGEWFDGLGGLSVYVVPPGVQRVSPYYGELAWARDSSWEQVLKAYHEEYV